MKLHLGPVLLMLKSTVGINHIIQLWAVSWARNFNKRLNNLMEFIFNFSILPDLLWQQKMSQ